MSIQIINPLTYPNYDAMLLERNDSSIFHSSSWARVLNKAYNYKPLYFSNFENGNFKTLLALMEVKSFLTGSRAVSLPFTDYCRPALL